MVMIVKIIRRDWRTKLLEHTWRKMVCFLTKNTLFGRGWTQIEWI